MSDRLQQNIGRIMQMWEKRARDEVAASLHQDSLVLQDSLPLYLNQLVDELSNRIERTSARIAADAVESTRIGKKHGHERAGYADYSMSQLIFEYRILRQVIFQMLEEEAPLDVATCNHKVLNLQSRHFQTRINCNYKNAQTSISCN